MKLKYLYNCAVALVLASALASCRSSGQVQQLPNGIKVEHIPSEQNDLAKTLDMKTWKYKLTLPKPNQFVSCILEIQQQGKAPRRVGGATVGPFADSHAEVFVGLHPLDDSWSKSDKFKGYVRVGPNSGASVEINPFKDCRSLRSEPMQIQEDGSLLLMLGFAKSSKRPLREQQPITMALKIQPQNRKYPT